MVDPRSTSSEPTYVVDSTKTVRDGIGILCHELGHALGLPDFYLTYGAKHNVPTPDYWSLMDEGCYWKSGYVPVGLTAYERNMLGWLKIQDLTTAQACELYPFGSGEDKTMAYRIVNPNNVKEYLILENRTPGTWYPSQFGSGMLVTRVNYDAAKWNRNTVNNTSTAMGYQVVAADSVAQKLSSVAASVAQKDISQEEKNLAIFAPFKGDLYPGTSNVTEVPSWAVYAGTTLEKPIYNIAYYKGTSNVITFSYLDRTIVSGIEGVQTTTEIPQTTTIYDLQGRRVTHPTRGLYIINGRKVFIP